MSEPITTTTLVLPPAQAFIAGLMFTAGSIVMSGLVIGAGVGAGAAVTAALDKMESKKGKPVEDDPLKGVEIESVTFQNGVKIVPPKTFSEKLAFWRKRADEISHADTVTAEDLTVASASVK